MNNTIIDFIKLSVDEYGAFLYDYDTIKSFYEGYIGKFPGRDVIMIPENIEILMDADIESLVQFRDKLNDIIERKQK